MKVLIIGLGSIAQKHIDALKKIDANANIWALRSNENANNVSGVTNIFNISECPEVDFVIISSPTAMHTKSIAMASNLNKPLFIEKPIFHQLGDEENEIIASIEKSRLPNYTAFNLRFLDSLKYLKEHLKVDNVQEVNVYCGSYLPSWRKNVDYKKSYSANSSLGGGIHLDLIHEVDYVLWLFEQPKEVKSTKRSNSKIGIDAIDYANFSLVYDQFVVNIVLNYFRKDTKRTCEIVLENDTWNVDLMENKINSADTNLLIYQSKQTILDTYTDQMKYFINNKFNFNTLKESVQTLKIALHD